MALETVAVKTATDAATQTVRAADSALKKFWSVLDAAAEKGDVDMKRLFG